MILGAGGHAKVCAEVAEEMSTWDSIEFLDDSKVGNTLLSHLVVGTIDQMKHYKTSHFFFVGIGDNTIRNKFYNDLLNDQFNMASLVSPSSLISRNAKINNGCLIMPGVIVNSGATIGENVIVNTGVIVEHDCNIMSHSHLSPGVILSGGVSVGNNVWIGSGAVVNHSIRICDEVTIGSNSTVIRDVDKKGTYAGSPLRKIR